MNTTKLPALVEQKPVGRRRVEVFEPLTLKERFEQKFLVVNCINDGKTSIFNFSGTLASLLSAYMLTHSTIKKILNAERYVQLALHLCFLLFDCKQEISRALKSWQNKLNLSHVFENYKIVTETEKQVG